MHHAARLLTTVGLLLVACESATVAQPTESSALGWPREGRVSADSFLVLPKSALLEFYRQSSPGNLPRGWIDGRAIVGPGSTFGPLLSRSAGVAWQGKTFRSDSTAINRFFGANVIEGEVSLGSSWLDGREAWILDYSRTSRIYRRFRDEIRMVSPGLYLGLMFDQTRCPPRLVRFFALEAPH